MDKKDYRLHKDEINSAIMEQASDIALERLEKAHPDDEVVEIDPDGDGESTRYKEQYQDEADRYYDEEYDRIAREMGFDFTAEDGIRRDTMTLSRLAETIYNSQLNEEVYFKTSPDSDLYGITRMERFDATFLFISYFGGHYMSVLDVTSDEEVPMIEKWLTAFLEEPADYSVYLLSRDELYSTHKKNETR